MNINFINIWSNKTKKNNNKKKNNKKKHVSSKMIKTKFTVWRTPSKYLERKT